VSDSSIVPDAVILPAGRLDQVTTKEQRVMAMQRAEQHMDLYPNDASTIVIRELLLELALLDGAYELLASLHRTNS
jgi:hypothetical protein